MGKITSKASMIGLLAIAVLLVGLGLGIMQGLSGLAAGVVYIAAALIIFFDMGLQKISRLKGANVKLWLGAAVVVFLAILGSAEFFSFAVPQIVTQIGATGTIVAGAVTGAQAFM